MHTNEERIHLMHQRATELKAENKNRKTLILSAVLYAASVAIVILIAVLMPNTGITVAAGGSAGELSASVFAGNGRLELIVIGIIAFLLGITVTVFCFRLNNWEKDSNRKDSHTFDLETGSTVEKHGRNC